MLSDCKLGLPAMFKAATETLKKQRHLERCNSPSASGFMYMKENEIRSGNHHFLRGGKWEILSMWGYLCLANMYNYIMSQSMEIYSPERACVVQVNVSCYVCAPVCPEFQCLSVETLGASRSVLWLTEWHFVNTPTQRKVKPLKSIYENRSIQVTQY